MKGYDVFTFKIEIYRKCLFVFVNLVKFSSPTSIRRHWYVLLRLGCLHNCVSVAFTTCWVCSPLPLQNFSKLVQRNTIQQPNTETGKNNKLTKKEKEKETNQTELKLEDPLWKLTGTKLDWRQKTKNEIKNKQTNSYKCTAGQALVEAKLFSLV